MSRLLENVSLIAALSCGAAGCAHTTPDGPWVHSLELKGVHNVSARKLKDGLATRPTSTWKRGPERSFDELELERDRTRVTRFYEEKGYYASKVVEAEAKKRPSGTGVDVVIAVEEGAPTFIGDVKVFGIDGLDTKTRKKIQRYQIGLQRGQVFHHSDYEQFKSDLTHILKERGFGDAAVDGVVDVSPQTNLATITLTFHPTGVVDSSMPSPPTAAEGEK